MRSSNQFFSRLFFAGALLFLATCAKPDSDNDSGTGLQLFTGADQWLSELRKLKNPSGVLPTGTDFAATGIMYDTWGTSYEFFAFDANVSLILMSNNPVYFIKIESREMQNHLKNELDQLRNGATPSTKLLNTITFYKKVGDYSVEVYFTPTELDFVSSGNNKDRLGDKNSTTYPDLDLWKLIEAAGNATFYTPSFDNQKIADDFYAQSVAGKRRLVLADSTSITNPANVNLKSYALNFSFMFGSNLTITDNLLGSEDIRFVDRYALTREFAAFFSVPVNNGATGISQKHGIVVVVRGELQNIRNFISGQGADIDATPVTPVYVPPATLMFTEISPAITGSFDLIELKVTAAGSLNGMQVQAKSSSTVNFVLPDIQVAVGDLIVLHGTGATEAGAAPGNETTGKSQYPVGTYAANFDNAWDIQVSAGLTATDTTLLVCSAACSSSTVQDAIALSNKDGTGSGAADTNLASLQSFGAWLPANCGGSACTDATTPSSQTIAASMNSVGTTRTGISVQRRNTGSYVDTNQASDWAQVAATFGADTVVTDGTAPTVGGGGTITANVISYSQIDLSWTAATDNITAQGALIYEICQSTSSTGCNTFTATYTNGAGVVTRSITGLSSNTLYYFVVRVTDGSANSSLYTQVSATTLVNSDVTAPSAVSTLAAGTVTSTSIQLNWTSVGDDAGVGTATSYEMRYLSAASCPINAGNFATGTLVASMPTPQASGNAETKTVTGLTASTSYCFAIKVSDEVPNQSAISNVVTQSTSAAVQPTLKNATAINSTTVDLNFSAAMAASSIDSFPGRFTFNNGLTASAATLQTGAPNANQRVRVTTSAQTPGTVYLVTVAGTVTDAAATGMDTGNNTASFNGFSSLFGIMEQTTAGMEGANATYWVNSGGTLNNNAGTFKEGANSLIWSTLTTSCTSGRSAQTIQYYPVTPGAAMNGSVFMRAGTITSGTVLGRIRVYWYQNNTGTPSATAFSLSSDSDTSFSSTSADWLTQHTRALTVPTDAYFARFQINACYTTTNTNQLFFDQVYLGP